MPNLKRLLDREETLFLTLPKAGGHCELAEMDKLGGTYQLFCFMHTMNQEVNNDVPGLYTGRTVAISINTSWNVYNFRRNLIQALQKLNYQVIIIAPRDAYSKRLEQIGCHIESIGLHPGAANPFLDIVLLFRYIRVLHRIRPNAFLTFTSKPNIYGSLAARICAIPVVNNISGLGSAYIKGGWIARLLDLLYRVSLSRSRIVFFQNASDRQKFVDSKIVNSDIARLIPGSGVDLNAFHPDRRPVPRLTKYTFLFVGRCLADKGLVDLVEAGRKLKSARGTYFNIGVLGAIDVSNPSGIPEETLMGWHNEGVIEYLGSTDTVRDFLSVTECVVLPSYREGLSRTLLESAAMGIPIITTSVPGCAEAVEEDVSGFLCSPGNSDSLASAMERFLELSSSEKTSMGEAGRRKAEAEFSETVVIESYLNVVQSIDVSSQLLEG